MWNHCPRGMKLPFGLVWGWWSTSLYYIYLGCEIDDQHRNPNLNNKNHQDGQLTRGVGPIVLVIVVLLSLLLHLICKHTFNSLETHECLELKHSFSCRDELLASSRSHSLPFSEPRVGVGGGVSCATIGLSILWPSSNRLLFSVLTYIGCSI